MSNISAAFANTFKRLYTEGNGLEIGLRDKPMLKMLMKRKRQYLSAPGSTDEGMIIPIRTAMASSFEGTLGAAEERAHLGTVDRFLVTSAVKYSTMTLTAADLRWKGRKDLGELIENKTRAMKGVVESFLSGLEQEICKGTSATHLGRATTVSASTLTVTTGGNLRGVQKGDWIIGYSDEAGTTSGSQAVQVTAIDRGAGTLVISDTAASAGIATNDYIFLTGNTANRIRGLPDYITSGSPSSLWGLNRTGDVEGLSGWKGAYRGSIRDTLKHLVGSQMAGYVNVQDSKILMAPGDIYTLEAELGGEVFRYDESSKEFGTQKIGFKSPIGSMEIVPVPYLRPGRGFIFNPESWQFLHVDDVPHVANEDGNEFLRVAGQDVYQWRLRGWMQVVCDSPLLNANFATA